MLERDEKYQTVLTLRKNGAGEFLGHTKKTKRPDKTPTRLVLAEVGDNRRYSKYGGAVLAVLEYCEGDKRSIRFNLSVCSTSDVFDFMKGVQIVNNRLLDLYIPSVTKEFDNLMASILIGKKKVTPTLVSHLLVIPEKELDEVPF